MRDLIARIEAAAGPSFDLDKAILAAIGFTWRGMAYWHSDNKTMWKGPATLTSSLDAALTLVPEGCAVMFGRGRVEPDEPLYGAIVYADMTGAEEIGKSETEAGMALALCAAALRARLAMQEAGDA